MGFCGPPDMRHQGGHIASGIFLPNIDHLHLIMGAIRQTHTERQGRNSYKVCVCVCVRARARTHTHAKSLQSCPTLLRPHGS